MLGETFTVRNQHILHMSTTCSNLTNKPPYKQITKHASRQVGHYTNTKLTKTAFSYHFLYFVKITHRNKDFRYHIYQDFNLPVERITRPLVLDYISNILLTGIDLHLVITCSCFGNKEIRHLIEGDFLAVTENIMWMMNNARGGLTESTSSSQVMRAI